MRSCRRDGILAMYFTVIGYVTHCRRLKGMDWFAIIMLEFLWSSIGFHISPVHVFSCTAIAGSPHNSVI